MMPSIPTSTGSVLPPNTSNPLAKLESNGYNVSSFTYPIDLTSDPGEQHMVLFYINTIKSTLGVSGSQYATNGGTPVDSNGNPATPQVNSNSNTTTYNKNNINRVSTLIALYIPSFQTTYATDWGQQEFGQFGAIGKALAGGNSSIQRAIEEFGLQIGVGAVKDLEDVISKHIGLNAPLLEAGTFITKTAINPHLEMLFRGIGFRTFQFQFKFTPRSEQEALTVANIISAFKFYSAPEVRSDKNTAKFLIYPSEFDIEFWSNGKQNNFLNKISTCALTSMTVDPMASGAWSAFRPGTNINGMAVETNLSLTFQELEVITKNRIYEGY
jgi:hypothetical protein